MKHDHGSQFLPFVIDQLADDAAFLWLRRDRAVADPLRSLADIRSLDDRLDANLDGLRLAGQAGWARCLETLEDGDAGEVFCASVLALESLSGNRLTAVLRAAAKTAASFRGFVSALGWVDERTAGQWLASMVRYPSPIYQRAAVAGLAIRRAVDKPDMLEAALTSEDLSVRARALRAIGESGRQELLPELHKSAVSDDPACRFWAIWSGALLRDSRLLQALARYVPAGDAFAHKAVTLVSRAMPPDRVHPWLRSLAQNPDTLRVALVGAAATGDPMYAVTLQKQMAVARHARIAGVAFATLTGAPIESLSLSEADAPDVAAESQDADAPDPDEGLPWPDPDAVAHWWKARAGQFLPGRRYLAGGEVSPGQCHRVLLHGCQSQRIAAALELALEAEGQPLFEWRAAGRLQVARLAGGPAVDAAAAKSSRRAAELAAT